VGRDKMETTRDVRGGTRLAEGVYEHRLLTYFRLPHLASWSSSTSISARFTWRRFCLSSVLAPTAVPSFDGDDGQKYLDSIAARADLVRLP
jgi:hypothetical protein